MQINPLLIKADFLSLSLFKEKRAGNLMEALEKAKSVTLSRFIFALGIRHIGEGTSQDLAKFILSHLKKTDGIAPTEIFELMHKMSKDEINAIEINEDMLTKINAASTRAMQYVNQAARAMDAPDSKKRKLNN